MTSRVDELSYEIPARRTATRAAARANLSVGQRALFVFALVTLGLASFYSAIALLTRVTPALFPGKEFDPLGIRSVLPDIPVLKVDPPGPESVFNKRINLLVIGVDKRPCIRADGTDCSLDEAAYNTDTLMVATIDPVTKVTSILSFPRDLWIEIHPPQGGVYNDRINASYATGLLNGGGTFDAGAKQLETDIKANFGIDIDYWVWLDFDSVEQLVDGIGGIDINVPDELAFDDWWYTDDDVTNPHYVSIPPGQQHLDGYNAVAFGRYRNGGRGDLDRVKRQQLVLQTAFRQSLSGGLLDDPLGLWDTYSHLVHTNIPIAKLGPYGLLLKDSAGQMNLYSLGDPVNGVDTVYGFTTEGGASVLGWNPDNVQYILSQVFTKAQYAQSSVEIQNGYGDDGFERARALGVYLKYSKGLPTVELGADAPVQPNSTITLYDDAKRDMAEDIAKWMGIPSSQIAEQKKASASQPDVVVVIGKDFKIPGS